MEDEIKTLKNSQIAAYGTVAYNRLKNSGNLEISELLVYSYILALLDLHNDKEIEQICSKLIKNE